MKIVCYRENFNELMRRLKEADVVFDTLDYCHLMLDGEEELPECIVKAKEIFDKNNAELGLNIGHEAMYYAITAYDYFEEADSADEDEIDSYCLEQLEDDGVLRLIDINKDFSEHDFDCWFPVMWLQNANDLHWKYAFYSEKKTPEGIFCTFNDDDEDVIISDWDEIITWNGWMDVVRDLYFHELANHYTVEYLFDCGFDRIVVRIKNGCGELVDTIYFWTIPAEDKSQLIWKSEDEDENEMPDESILLTEEECEDERENNAWIRGTFSSAQEFEQWAEGTMED